KPNETSEAQRWWRAGAKAALERTDLNQSQAARRMGDASESYLSRALSASRTTCGVGLEYLFGFCRALEVSPIDLLTWGRDRVRAEEAAAAQERHRRLRAQAEAEDLRAAMVDALLSIPDPDQRRDLLDQVQAAVDIEAGRKGA
ncbi:MAG: hypothetical protein AAGD06_17050, partial [Acidobacteriota bacterium]